MTVWNSAAFQFSADASLPRAPTSSVRDTTCSSGGSDCSALGSTQALAGSEQPSSIGLGARLPWLRLPNQVTAGLACQVRPSAG